MIVSEVAKLRMFEMAKLREEFLGKVTFLIQKLFMILILFFVSASGTGLPGLSRIKGR